MSRLFDPVRIGPIEVRNRVWLSPMCQYSVTKRDGIVTDWHLVHLGTMARGGVGLVLTESTAVLPEGRISPQDTGIWGEEHVAPWARIVDVIRAAGATPGIQLGHAGRKASTYEMESPRQGTVPAEEGGWPTVAPSAIPNGDMAVPEALDEAGIRRVIDAFRAAAERAIRAGFDVLEIHAAHGYLLHQFLSPLSNARTDSYGGSLENRARLLLEVIRAVREVATEQAVIVRYSATDWTEGGLTVDETATVVGWAAEAGSDFSDISSGGNTPDAVIPVGPGYQVPAAALIRERTGTPVAVVGMISDPIQAETILATGQADAVLVARELLRDPHFALRAAGRLRDDRLSPQRPYLRGGLPGTRG